MMINIEFETKVSDQTVRRVLSSSWWKTVKPKVVPNLSTSHMVMFMTFLTYRQVDLLGAGFMRTTHSVVGIPWWLRLMRNTLNLGNTVSGNLIASFHNM